MKQACSALAYPLSSPLVPFSENEFYMDDNLEWVIRFEDDFSTGMISTVFGNSILKRVAKPAETGA